MRVGAYIDGLNLYYKGRAHCGRDQPGWRWLDFAPALWASARRAPRLGGPKPNL